MNGTGKLKRFAHQTLPQSPYNDLKTSPRFSRLAFAVGCCHQALLLTGTGITNQAALHACGLNAEEAKQHLRKAVASGEEGVVAPAAEALKWCEEEVRGISWPLFVPGAVYHPTPPFIQQAPTDACMHARMHAPRAIGRGFTVL